MQLMGWTNPPIPWNELERQLSGRPASLPAPRSITRPPEPDERGGADGGDSPAWSRKRTPYEAASIAVPSNPVPYAELHAHSSFSFLDGASSPEELAEEAVRLGLQSLAITDHDGVYGVVRYAEAAKALGLNTMYGAELGLDLDVPKTRSERMISARGGTPDPPGRHLLVLARDSTGYASLCQGISAAHRRGGSKGHPVYDLDELAQLADGHWLILTGCRKGPVRQALEAGGFGTFALDPARAVLADLVDRFGSDNVAVELTYARDPLADDRYDALSRLAQEAGLPIVATTAAHYHAPTRRPLASALAAIRARSSLDELDGWLPAWSDSHLRSGEEMAARFARWPGAVEATARLGAELSFGLHLLAPQLPPFPVPPGQTEMTHLRQLVYTGALEKYGSPEQNPPAYKVLEHELSIIEELGFPGYFLVVWDIVWFCRDNGILCQGRGSAANSAVCYAIGITAVDAVKHNLMFERFLAPERGEPPDIDVDIESDRRELAIQHVYERYGRDNAAQVANVITYRPRSAIRDVAKALGYSAGQQDAWSKQIEMGYYWSPRPFGNEASSVAHSDSMSVSPGGPDADPELTVPAAVVELASELQNTPRHLGIHSGGMVICDRPIVEVCPVEWGRMPNRTVLQWDKDDCASIGLVKFDLLGLGMLSALHYCFEMVAEQTGVRLNLYDIPEDDSRVYDMLCAADTIGVFQVESRAQMATLPRLKPRKFYDLVIEVALIRPGPIQGNSVHPYIRRRHGVEEITYPHPKLKDALERTLGIPLFQEQLMQIAVAAADFTAAEADQLRRAMGSKRSGERIDAMRRRLYDGMAKNSITGKTADEIFEKIKAFAAFGFAESHSISFAFLVYASSWLKLHHPAAFCAALLNAQPMGFYSPQSLVHDAKRHGIVVLGPDINLSDAVTTLEKCDGGTYAGPGPTPQPAVRMGLTSVRTIEAALGQRVVSERQQGGPFTSMSDLAYRVGLSTDQVEALATAGAFDGFGLTRREALWDSATAAANRPNQLDLPTITTAVPALPEMSAPEQLMADLWATGITRDCYPTVLIRDRLDALGIVTASTLRTLEDHTRVTVGGIVTHRQRPATARGVTFINLEDETGMVNVICDAVVWGRHRKIARDSGGLVIRGMLERVDGVANVLAERIEKLPLGLRSTARNFR
jgi:error-prone DNA polymerase